MSFDDDLADILDTADGLAVEAFLQDSQNPVTVIFNDGFRESVGAIGSTNPTALGRVAELPVTVIGKTLRVRNVLYTIRQHKPQENALLVLLELHKNG